MQCLSVHLLASPHSMDSISDNLSSMYSKMAATALKTPGPSENNYYQIIKHFKDIDFSKY